MLNLDKYSNVQKISKNTYRISLYVPIKDLLKLYENGQLLDLGVQRGHVWPHNRAALLVESLLDSTKLVPQTIVGMHEKNPFLSIVDGKQRLTAIKRFSDDVFRVRTTDNTSKFFSEFTRTEKARFLSTTVNICFIVNQPTAQLNNIFVDVQKGMSLRLGETLNAITNSVGQTVRRIMLHSAFTLLPTTNNRQKHQEISAKLYTMAFNTYGDTLPVSPRTNDIMALYTKKEYAVSTYARYEYKVTQALTYIYTGFSKCAKTHKNGRVTVKALTQYALIDLVRLHMQGVFKNVDAVKFANAFTKAVMSQAGRDNYVELNDNGHKHWSKKNQAQRDSFIGILLASLK